MGDVMWKMLTCFPRLFFLMLPMRSGFRARLKQELFVKLLQGCTLAICVTHQQFVVLDRIVAALLRTRTSDLTSPAARAYASGESLTWSPPALRFKHAMHLAILLTMSGCLCLVKPRVLFKLTKWRLGVSIFNLDQQRSA